MPIEPSNERRSLDALRRPALVLVGTLIAGFCLAPLSPARAAPAPTSAAENQAAQPGHIEGAFRIVAFGSSSTQGIGATSPAASYPADLERLLNGTFHGRPPVSVVNRGIGGEDIDDMAKRLKSDVLARKPDLVIWQVGSNDSLRGVPIERFDAELKTGIAAIRSSGAEVILMEPQWCPAIAAVAGSRRFVDAVRSVGLDEHVEVIRRYDMMERWMADGLVTRQDLIGPDNLHMTDKGYALLAKAVLSDVSTTSVAFRERMALTVSNRP